MPKDIVIDPLDSKSISSAINELKKYKDWVQKKETELRLRLAELGRTVASIQFSNAVYDGVNDVYVRVDNTGSVAVIYAEGNAVAFIEFGSGAAFGYGHPEASKFDAGPGTYPNSKGHWNDPNGWWYEHGKHSDGNPPAMAMVEARDRIAEQVTSIAKEVFK